MAHVLRSSLASFGRKVYSQNDEDGIIEAIFQDIPPRSKFFIEFGIGPNWLDPDHNNGLEGNCVLLREQGWQGIFMDGGEHPERFNVEREFITPFNINGLLRKYNTPDHVDIVSIDVDGQDLWIWMALDYRPTLIIIELNPNFRFLHESWTVNFDARFRWDGTKYYGASLGALVNIGRDKGYKLVYANGTNAFFVRHDLLKNPEDFEDDALKQFLDQHNHDHFNRPWTAV